MRAARNKPRRDNAALTAAADVIARTVFDLAHLIEQLDAAGLPRLAAALRERPKGPAEIRGAMRLDPELWRTGKLNR